MNDSDRQTLSSYSNASFEEQFDCLVTLVPPKATVNQTIDTIIEWVEELGGIAFIERIATARELLQLQGVAITVEAIRAAGILLVGGDYSLTHPLNPQDSVERLRNVKRTILLTPVNALHRSSLMRYIMEWEMVLTPDEVALYLA